MANERTFGCVSRAVNAILLLLSHVLPVLGRVARQSAKEAISPTRHATCVPLFAASTILAGRCTLARRGACQVHTTDTTLYIVHHTIQLPVSRVACEA